MANETTTKFKVDISELKSKFQDASRQIRIANSEFKAATAGMDNWGTSVDGISAKMKQLTSVLDAQKTQLSSLEGQYALVSKEQGENSKGAQELLIKINNQKAAISKTEAELKKYSARLDDVADDSKDAANSQDDFKSSMDKLSDEISDQESELEALKKKYANLVLEQGKNSKEAKQTAKQIQSLSSELNENKSKAASAEKAADSLTDSLDNMGDGAKGAEDGFTVLKGAIATFAGNLLTGAVNGIKNLASSILGLGESTREYRGLMNKLDAAARDSGIATEFAKEKYQDLYGVLGDETAAQTTISNFMAMGASQEELNDLVDISTGIWAKYGDSIPLDGLAESINETKRVGKVTGNLADALNWAGVNEDDFNEKLAACSTEQERQQLIIDTLNDKYGKISKTYKQNNKDIIAANKANARFQDIMAKVGAKVEPITTALKNGFSGLLEKILALVDGVDITVFTNAIADGFSYLSDTVLPAVQSGFQWIMDNKDILIAGIAGIGAAFVVMNVANMIMGVVKAFKAFKLAQEGATVAQWLLNVAMNANPIGILVAAIVGLVAAFVVLWKKSEAFRNFWIGLWDNISSFFSSVWENIKSFCATTIPQIISNIGTWFSELPGKIWTWLVNAYDKVSTWGSNMWTKAQDVGSKFISKVVEFIKQLPAKIWVWLTNAYSKVVTWADNMLSKAKDAGSKFIDKVIEFIKQLPGKVWSWLVNTYKKVVTWANNMVNKAKDVGSKFINKVIEYVKQLPGKVWTWLVNVVSKVTTWASNMLSKAKTAGSDFINKVVDYIKQLPSKVWTWLVSVVTKVGTWSSNMVSKAKTAGSNFINKVVEYVKQLPGKIWTWLVQAAGKVVTWGTSLASKGAAAATKLFNAVVNGITGLPGKMLDIGGNIVSGIWNGISNGTQWIKDKISGWVGNVTSFLRDLFGIGSPSKLMRDEVGKWLPAGMAEGITKNSKAAISAVKDMGKKVLSEGQKQATLFDDLGINSDAFSTAKSSIGSMTRNNQLGKNGSIANGKVTNVYNQNFYQTNNSPKSLSRLEIYRQTRNQLSFAKGV
jgi:phage-related protein